MQVSKESVELSSVWWSLVTTIEGELEGKCLADAEDDNEEKDEVQRMCLVGDRACVPDAPDDGAGWFKLAVLMARGHCALASSIKSDSALMTGESALLRCNEASLYKINNILR